MNKKVSKTLAAVLSAAMAASAFAMSTGAAFAADTNTGVDGVKVTPATVAVTTATGDSKAYWLPSVNSFTAQFEVTVNGQTYKPSTVTPIPSFDWQSSNTSIATVDSNGKVTVVNENISDRQMVSLTRKVKLTMTNQEVGRHDKTGTLTAEATLQVDLYVYPDGGYAILPSANASNDPPIENTYKLSVNEGEDFNVYSIGTASNGTAKFQSVEDRYGKYSDIKYTSSVSGIPVNSRTGVVDPQDPENVTTGAATISATSSQINTEGKYIVPAQVEVDPTFAVEGSSYTTVEKKYNTDTATYLKSYVKESVGKLYEVTGKDLILKSNNRKTNALVLTNNSVVGNITDKDGAANTVYVEGSKTGNIEADTINVDTLHTQHQFPDNTVMGGRQPIDTNKSNVEDSKASAVETGSLTGTTVNVEGTQARSNGAYQPTTVGDINAQNIKLSSREEYVNGAYNAQGAVKAGDIAINANGQLELSTGETASAVTVGEISGYKGRYADCPYSAKLIVDKGTFQLGDLTAIGEVTIGNNDAAKANVTVGAIDTGTYDWISAAPCKLTSASQVKVSAQSTLNAKSIRTSYVDPSSKGTFVVPVNSFEIFTQNGYKQQKITGATLSVPDAKEGDILYTTAGEWGQLSNLFKTPNATLVAAEDTGKNVWTYSIGKADLRGIQVDKTTLEVGKTPETLTLTTVPASVGELPDGVTVKWDTTKNSVKLTPSADGMSCTVEAVGYTENNINDSNHATVTATLIDKDGSIYDEFGTAASSTKTEVTLTDKAEERPLTGISLNKSIVSMKPKATRQLAVSYAPEDTSSDKTVAWTSSDPEIATVDKNGLVTGVKYGKATITAKVGDFTATCPVVISKSGMLVKITDLDGKVTECMPDGSSVLDVPQSTAYRVELTSDTAVSEFSYNAGNGKVGGTNTLSVWNGTAGTYEAYAAGKVGEQTGFYVNGDKLFDLQVVARPFTSDTTLTANVPVGKSYTFRITPQDKNAKFTFSTANGAAVATSYKKATYPDANGDYYCTITTKQAVGNVGVYCNIDGKNYKIFAANTRA